MTPDPRMDRVERDVDRVQEQVNNLHSSSMQLVTTAFTEMERRLGDKLDKQTRELKEELDGLRKVMVPLNEHETLMKRVDVLYERDVQGREDWNRIVPQVGVLWDERTQRQGAGVVWRWAVAIGGFIVVVLTAANLIHSLGFHP